MSREARSVDGLDSRLEAITDASEQPRLEPHAKPEKGASRELPRPYARESLNILHAHQGRSGAQGADRQQRWHGMTGCLRKRLVQRSHGLGGSARQDAGENEAEVPPAPAAPAHELLRIANAADKAAVAAAPAMPPVRRPRAPARMTRTREPLLCYTCAASFPSARTKWMRILCRQGEASRMVQLNWNCPRLRFLRTALWQGTKPQASSKSSWTRTPPKTPRKASAKRGGHTAQHRAQRRPRRLWDTSRRKDGREIRSEIRSGQVILGPSLFFSCSSMSSAFRSGGFRLHLHEDIQ